MNFVQNYLMLGSTLPQNAAENILCLFVPSLPSFIHVLFSPIQTEIQNKYTARHHELNIV
jgi:hypothetical protein